MEKQIGLGLYGESLRRFLIDNADRIEPISYNEEFSDEEVTQFKHELSELALDIDRLEIKKKTFMELLKMELDPVKKQYADRLEKIRDRQQSVKKECYVLVDHDSRTTGYYNSEGVLVFSRRSLPQELQFRILTKNGTHGE